MNGAPPAAASRIDAAGGALYIAGHERVARQHVVEPCRSRKAPPPHHRGTGALTRVDVVPPDPRHLSLIILSADSA